MNDKVNFNYFKFISNKTPAQAFTPPADEKKMGTIYNHGQNMWQKMPFYSPPPNINVVSGKTVFFTQGFYQKQQH